MLSMSSVDKEQGVEKLRPDIEFDNIITSLSYSLDHFKHRRLADMSKHSFDLSYLKQLNDLASTLDALIPSAKNQPEKLERIIETFQTFLVTIMYHVKNEIEI